MTRDARAEALDKFIRDVPDFPKLGIVFKDIAPLLQDKAAFGQALDWMRERALDKKPDVIAAIEARGFIFGAALAGRMNLGFVPIRKPGKLPFKTHKIQYALEYGTDAIEVHQDAVQQGQRVLLVDDLLATGGTAHAAAELLTRCGADVAGCVFLVELAFLPGREKLADWPVDALLTYT